jgi:hypothetical protein
MSLALVLGGGGVAGVAWETGFLLGVQDESPETVDRLLQPDVILGTSAGAIVGRSWSLLVVRKRRSFFGSALIRRLTICRAIWLLMPIACWLAERM